MYRTIVVTATCLLLFSVGNISSETDAPISEEDFFTTDGPTDDATTEPTIDEDNEGGEVIPRQRRTIYGYTVNEYNYSYVVSIRDHYYLHYCGGTILTPRLILTAAHCVEEEHKSFVAVFSHYGPSYYEVSYSITHPYYSDKYNVNDIALLVLEQRIPNAQIVSLQSHPETVSGCYKAYALGWGQTEYGFMSQKLRRVNVPILYTDQCDSYEELDRKLVCIDTKRGNICFGDSGGPLMYGHNQVGVASYVRGPDMKTNPCTSGMSSAFTRISAYYSWIQRYVRNFALETNASISEQDFDTNKGLADDAIFEPKIDEDNEGGKTVRRQKRMISGYEVNEYDYPYVVSLIDHHQSHHCGGTILTPSMILTAAHCVSEFQISYIVAFSRYGPSYHNIAQFIIHEHFRNNGLLVNDLALLVLEQSIPNARAVSLQPYFQEVPYYSRTYALGWGQTENGFMSQKLRRVDVLLLHPSQCQSHEDQKLICIDTMQGNVCGGDSGGPLMDGNNQVGVTSYGLSTTVPMYPWSVVPVSEKCMSGMPAAFTRISAYYSWIQQYVRKYR
ncbi:hypothetical protein QAD02_004398 [Eretmocerus hayati]|uniref:Uncharacterized protein n=1 Tax=Eretmocerus hayati TaxID=131215 RepID=A0ACC2NRB9_9HYME|nr:hypothetical protein QAD02_004398 [Eretmocerus hayati]